MEVKPLSLDILSTFNAVDEEKVNELLKAELEKLNKKIVVLDDDPTGVQTVHDINVYTDWEKDTLKKVLKKIIVCSSFLLIQEGLLCLKLKKLILK